MRETYTLQADGAAVDISVTALHTHRSNGRTHITISVRYHDRGPGSFEVDPSAWTLITSDGENVTLAPTVPGGLDAGQLEADQTRTGGLGGSVKATPDQTFVSFTDPNDVIEFVVPTN